MDTLGNISQFGDPCFLTFLPTHRKINKDAKGWGRKDLPQCTILEPALRAVYSGACIPVSQHALALQGNTLEASTYIDMGIEDMKLEELSAGSTNS